MARPRALDLFAGGGGVSVGLARAGFEVVGVDENPRCEPYWRRGMEPHGGQFIVADALEVLDEVDWLLQFDLICASPPCQGYSSLRHLCKGKVYPRLIEPVRERLDACGVPWVIENVVGAPLGESGNLVTLCGTMFGLQTPDGRAEIRRHRLFESSFPLPQPTCRHGGDAITIAGHAYEIVPGGAGYHRRVITVSGDRPNSSNTPRQTLVVSGHSYQGADAHSRRKVLTVAGATPQRQEVHNVARETFSIDDARAAMGIDWMPMRFLSQAIPPAYAEWIGRVFLGWVPENIQVPLWWGMDGMLAARKGGTPDGRTRPCPVSGPGLPPGRVL